MTGRLSASLLMPVLFFKDDAVSPALGVFVGYDPYRDRDSNHARNIFFAFIIGLDEYRAFLKYDDIPCME